MVTLKLEYGDILVVDPCYVKNVATKWDGQKEQRFDGLRCGKVLYSGDDGCFDVWNKDFRLGSLGVDSGRIWAFVAEFEVEVEVDSGLSGHIVLRNKGENYSAKDRGIENLLGRLEVK